MSVNSISLQKANQKKRSIINPKTTGYIATASIGLTIASGIIKDKSIYKSHKYFAGISLIATLAHIYLVSIKHKILKH